MLSSSNFISLSATSGCISSNGNRIVIAPLVLTIKSLCCSEQSLRSPSKSYLALTATLSSSDSPSPAVRASSTVSTWLPRRSQQHLTTLLATRSFSTRFFKSKTASVSSSTSFSMSKTRHWVAFFHIHTPSCVQSQPPSISTPKETRLWECRWYRLTSTDLGINYFLKWRLRSFVHEYENQPILLWSDQRISSLLLKVIKPKTTSEPFSWSAARPWSSFVASWTSGGRGTNTSHGYVIIRLLSSNLVMLGIPSRSVARKAKNVATTIPDFTRAHTRWWWQPPESTIFV